MAPNHRSAPRKRRSNGNHKRSLSLCDAIKNKMVLHDESKLRFIPETSLKSIFGKQEIAEALERSQLSPEADITALVSFIRDKATRVFAILAWNDQESFIEQFYDCRFGDDLLPVGCNTRDKDNFQVFSYKPGDKSFIENHPFNYEGWTERKLEHLCDHQWLFLSPVFSEDQFRYDFHESIRLPFVDPCFRSQKESFFSVVQEWRIHRDHLKSSNYMVSLSSLSRSILLWTKNKFRLRFGLTSLLGSSRWT